MPDLFFITTCVALAVPFLLLAGLAMRLRARQRRHDQIVARLQEHF